MTEKTQHEVMVDHLRNGVAALAQHTQVTTDRVAQYLESTSPETTTTEVEQ